MRPHLLLLLSINYRRRDEKRAPQKTPAWEARSDQDIFFSVLQQNASNSKERECSRCCCKYLHDLKVRTELKTQIFIRIKEKALHSQVYIT